MRLKSGQIVLTLVCVLLGVMLATQFRLQQNMASDVSRLRSGELTAYVTSLEKEREQLREEISGLRSQLSEIAEGRNIIASLRTELDSLRNAAGLTEMRGPGLTVIMEDSKAASKPGQDPNAYIIHDDDVLRLINELLASGAEAISINGQRYTNWTEIRCVGPTISINNTRTAPPIIIRAVGDPQILESGLRMRGGIVESLAFWSINVGIKREEEVYIPAFKGGFKFEFAQPVVKKAGEK